MIEPLVLKGFRDSLPLDESYKKENERKLEKIFTSYGFSPIDTPALEYTDVLLGKGGGETDKQIFRFTDNGGRDVALRFDLTVPFARFTASHLSTLPLPFKRYHIAKVWRGENPQKGRYREFVQCDFDIAGMDTAEADFEILSVMDASMKVLGVERYKIRVSHRGLLNEFLNTLGEEGKTGDVLRIVDKLKKIGKDNVSSMLKELVKKQSVADDILRFISLTEGKDFPKALAAVKEVLGLTESVMRVEKVYSYLKATGIEDNFLLDITITRGLDYYTGLVYETFLDKAEHIGSVCSGGRYNDLASLYTKEKLPGVGSSIGLDRLLSALDEIGLKKEAPSASLLASSDKGDECVVIKAVKSLREKGLDVDLYPSSGTALKKLYSYAEKNRIPYLLTYKDGKFFLRDLALRETAEVALDEIAENINGL